MKPERIRPWYFPHLRWSRPTVLLPSLVQKFDKLCGGTQSDGRVSSDAAGWWTSCDLREALGHVVMEMLLIMGTAGLHAIRPEREDATSRNRG